MQTFIDLIVEVETELRNKKIRDTVRRWVNRAHRTICRTYPWSFCEVEVTTPATINTPNYYSLPPDFNQALSLRFQDLSGTFTKLEFHPIQRLDFSKPDQTESSATPEFGVVTGRTLLLFPAPTAVGGTVILRYLRTPPLLVNDSDVPLVPDPYRDVIIAGASLIGSRHLWNDKGEQDRFRRDLEQGFSDMVRLEKGDNSFQESIGLPEGLVDELMDSGT